MNGIFKSTLLASAVVSMAVSCSDDPEKKTAPDGQMIAAVGGASWHSLSPSATKTKKSIRIRAEGDDGSDLEINVLSGNVPGTYSVKGDFLSSQAIISVTDSEGHIFSSDQVGGAAKTGEVVITEIDEQHGFISGMFFSKTKRADASVKEIEIRDGSFTKIPFTIGPDDLVSVTIDGVDFVPDIIHGAVSTDKIILIASTNERSLFLTFPPDVPVGGYLLGPALQSDVYATYLDNFSPYESVLGTVNITMHDTEMKRIEGTFSFSAEPFLVGGTEISFTEGSFAVSY